MRRILAVLIIILSAGCVMPGVPGFDYDTEPAVAPGTGTILSLVALPDSVGLGESLVIYADYSSDGQLLEDASCLLEIGDIRSEMTYSSQGYGGTVDTGGLEKGTYFVAVTCQKPGFQTKDAGISFTIK